MSSKITHIKYDKLINVYIYVHKYPNNFILQQRLSKSRVQIISFQPRLTLNPPYILSHNPERIFIIIYALMVVIIESSNLKPLLDEPPASPLRVAVLLKRFINITSFCSD